MGVGAVLEIERRSIAARGSLPTSTRLKICNKEGSEKRIIQGFFGEIKGKGEELEIFWEMEEMLYLHRHGSRANPKLLQAPPSGYIREKELTQRRAELECMLWGLGFGKVRLPSERKQVTKRRAPPYIL